MENLKIKNRSNRYIYIYFCLLKVNLQNQNYCNKKCRIRLFAVGSI